MSLRRNQRQSPQGMSPRKSNCGICRRSWAMTKNKQTLIAWLRDAHAMERASVDSLDRMADRLARFPELSGGLREHWRLSVTQAQRIEVCLRALGADTSTFKD